MITQKRENIRNKNKQSEVAVFRHFLFKTEVKKIFISLAGALGGVAVHLFGKWDAALQTLILFMAIDWITGGIILPAVFKKSPKSGNGALESRAGWKGLCRKGMTLLFVLIATQLDLLAGTSCLRTASAHGI